MAGKHQHKKSQNKDDKGNNYNPAAASKDEASKNAELLKIAEEIVNFCSSPLPQGTTNLWNHYVSISKLIEHVRCMQCKGREDNNTNQDDQEVLQNFLTWSQDNNIEAFGVTVDKFSSYRCGLRASKELFADELVVKVPRDVILSADLALNPNCALYYAVRSDPLLKSMPHVALSFLLLYEKLKLKNVGRSTWKPYIMMLPCTFNTPSYYSMTDFEYLKAVPDGGVLFETAVRLYRNVARQFAYFYQLIANKSGAFQRLNIDGESFTYDLYRWAVSAVMTRQNLIPLDETSSTLFQPGEVRPAVVPALIPFWDMGNHVTGEVSTDYNVEDHSVVCYCTGSYKPGEQVFFCYGQRSNTEFLIYNGFVAANNPHTTAKLRLGLSKADVLLQRKLAVLSRFGLDAVSVADFELAKHEPVFTDKLLLFVRVFLANEDEMRLVESKSAIAELVEFVPKPVWSFLVNRLQILLKTSLRSADENRKLMESKSSEGEELSQNSRFILQLTIEYQEIMQRALELASQKCATQSD